MAYHEAFWVAVAAAAPVIALANTVSITDAVGVWLGAKTRQRPWIAANVYFGVFSLAALNFFTQAFLMYGALESLLAEKDKIVMPKGAAIGVSAGLLVVFVTVTYDVVLRYALRNVEAEAKKE